MFNVSDICDDLIKGEGEGTRGGKIIGHTKSGKPIYESHGNKNHKGFTKKDHQQAAEHHGDKLGPIAHEMSQQHNGDGTYSKKHAKKKAQLQKQYDHHRLQRDRHDNSANPKPREPDQRDFDRMDRQNDPHKRSRSWGRSDGINKGAFKELAIEMGDTHMDKETKLLKSLGFSTENNGSLIQTVNDTQGSLIEKGFAHGEQSGRVGLGGNARDRLMGTITPTFKRSDYGSENLKGMRGEEHHTDNKKMYEGQDEIEEIDSVHPVDEQENMAVKVGKKIRTDGYQLSTPDKNPPRPEPVGAIKRSLTQEELFLKAMGELVPDAPAKKCSTPMKKGPLKDWAEEEEEEHDIQKPAKLEKSASVLDDLFDSLPIAQALKKLNKAEEAGPDDSLIQTVKEKPVKNLAKLHENSPGVAEKRRPAPLQKGNAIPFLKSAGPGGYRFDFGPNTGNPLADNATALLNRHADPVQAQIAAQQSQGYDKALDSWVNKGEMGHTGSEFGKQDAGWNDMMNKPMDQQVEEAYKSGALIGKGPAAINQFNEVQANVGGEVVKATSPTDAAVLEMFKAEMEAANAPGTVVADARFGGAVPVTVDAQTGKAL